MAAAFWKSSEEAALLPSLPLQSILQRVLPIGKAHSCRAFHLSWRREALTCENLPILTRSFQECCLKREMKFEPALRRYFRRTVWVFPSSCQSRSLCSGGAGSDGCGWVGALRERASRGFVQVVLGRRRCSRSAGVSCLRALSTGLQKNGSSRILGEALGCGLGCEFVDTRCTLVCFCGLRRVLLF